MAEGGTTPEQRLGLPYTVRKTPQVMGRVKEKQMAKERGARLHPNSGAGRIKDDASSDTTQYEFKNVSKTHTLKGSDLLALFKRAIRQGKEAEYVIYFENEDLTATVTLQRGRHG